MLRRLTSSTEPAPTMLQLSTRLAVLLLFVLLPLLPSAALADGLSLEQLGKIESVSEVAISPDGETIAYILTVPRNPYLDSNGPARQHLHVVDGPDSSRPFVTGRDDLSNLAWSPDGEHLSFLATSETTGYQTLFIIPLRGGEARRITDHEADIGFYTWAPDSRRIAFQAREPEPEFRTRLTLQGFGARVHEEAVEPVRVWILDVDPGSGPRSPERLPELEGSVSDIVWAPEGDRLALMLAPTPLIDDHLMYRQMAVVDTGTGEIVQRFEHEGKKGAPVWSPDASRIAFVGSEDINDPQQGRLMVASMETGEFRDILPGYEGHVQSLVWEDNKRLTYLGHTGVYSELARIDRDGENRQQLIAPGQPILRSLSRARHTGRLAMVADAPDHPREVYVFDGSKAERWTDSNPWLADVRLAEQEVIRYQARDGLEIEGILVHPLDGRGEPAPTILTIHGGPEAHDSHGWESNYARPAQVAAARGYAMFFPNYRGSTARGVAFSRLGQNDPAGAEFDDILDARNHLIDIGVAREGQIGITGRSYGGYASAWAATAHSEYYDASVIAVGAGENISKFGTSDITQELYLVHLMEWPWENREMYVESSPIHYAGQSRTPTLILHGEQDPRVHVSQGLILHRFLKLQGQAPVRLVTYPDEAHATNNATNQRDYSMRLMRWMDHFLVDGADELPDHELDHSEWMPEEE